MKNVVLVFFGAVSVGELISQSLNQPWLHTVCKPVLLPLLAAFYIISCRQADRPVSVLMVLALMFSWAGDVLLMGEGELFFMLGLAAFLLAHVVYFFVYRQHQHEDDEQGLKGLQRIRFAFPILLAGTGLIVILLPNLGELMFPVLLYAAVLTAMALRALFRFGRTNTLSFAWVFGGAILFMMSDSLLAVNKFIEPVTLGGFWIMITYITAQYAIVRGIVSHA
jgi:uncharacterized membrane protein YhhN